MSRDTCNRIEFSARICNRNFDNEVSQETFSARLQLAILFLTILTTITVLTWKEDISSQSLQCKVFIRRKRPSTCLSFKACQIGKNLRIVIKEETTLSFVKFFPNSWYNPVLLFQAVKLKFPVPQNTYSSSIYYLVGACLFLIQN